MIALLSFFVENVDLSKYKLNYAIHINTINFSIKKATADPVSR